MDAEEKPRCCAKPALSALMGFTFSSKESILPYSGTGVIMAKRTRLIAALWADCSGASAAEYSLMLAVVGSSIAVGAWTLRESIIGAIDDSAALFASNGASNAGGAGGSGSSSNSGAGNGAGAGNTPGAGNPGNGAGGGSAGSNNGSGADGGSSGSPGNSGGGQGNSGSTPAGGGDPPGQAKKGK